MYDPVEITRRLIFGTNDPSIFYSDHIRPDSAKPDTQYYDMGTYLTSGGGRYAYPSLFGAVRKFFDSTTLLDKDYTFAELTSPDLLNLSEADRSLFISQYGTDIFSADLAERAYIFGTTEFKLEISRATFRVSGGVKSIDGIEVRAVDDGFDFQAGSKGAQLVNDVLLKPTLDPYGLARGEVVISYTGSGKTYVNYGQPEFAADRVKEANVNVSGSSNQRDRDLAGISALVATGGIPYFSSILSDRFLSYKNYDRKVIYGTPGDDNLDKNDVKVPYAIFDSFQIVGGDGNDTITGANFDDLLQGGSGNDILSGGWGNDLLNSGDGDDTLDGGLGDDYFIGSNGNDTINGGSFVFGLFGGTDTASYRGESSEYDIEYLPDKSVRISDKVADRDGIDTLTGVEKIVFSDKPINPPPPPVKNPPGYAREPLDPLGPFNNPPPRPGCPLVLDLDGDGIELTTLSDQVVRFDLDQDGFREATGWVKPDDGLLVYDRNADGFINDLSELFGTQDTTDSGFKHLQPLDTNGDGWISSADTNFAALQVWRDLDQDGMSDSNELFSLNQLGIARINTAYSRVATPVPGQNTIADVSTYERTDGTQRQIVDAWFALDQLNSEYDFRSTANPQLTFTNELFNLPTLAGYGNLPILTIAMAQDSQLLNLVRTFTQQMQQGNSTGIDSAIQAILYQWAGVSNTAPDRGSFIDARKLAFLEKFLGQTFLQGNNPWAEAGAALNTAYDELSSALAKRLIAQTINGSVTYDVLSDQLSYNGTVAQAVSQFLQQVESTTPLGELNTSLMVQFLKEEGVNTVIGGVGNDILRTQVGRQVIVGRAGSDTIFAGYGDDTIDGGDGADVIDASFDNDVVLGGAGNDSINGSNGNDTIDGGTGNDTLLGENGNDSIIGGSGDDTIYGGSNDDSINGGSDNDFIDGGDGNDTIDGGDGNDYIYGGYGTDIINGGGGNDTLDGANDNDIYIFERGGGQDTIEGNIYSLKFGAGIVKTDLIINFNGWDLTFIVKPATGSTAPADTITLKSFNWLPNFRTIIVDGQTLTLTEIMSSLTVSRDDSNYDTMGWEYTAIKFDGADGNDTINTGSFNDTIYGGDGADVIQVYAGNDSVFGDAGSDSLIGGDGDDTIDGGGDDDFITGGTGSDILFGNWGNDTYYFYRGDGQDIIHDFQLNNGVVFDGGNDTLFFDSGISLSDLAASANGSDLLITVSGGTDSITIRNFYASSNPQRIENFSIGGQLFTINQIPSTINGTTGNDTLVGTAAPNTINGLAGNDFLSGGDGNDTLNGGDGNDTLDGGIGNDLLVGGTGNDSYIVDSVSDVINETSVTTTEVDSVTTTATYTLGANLENLTLAGSLAINGTGNVLDNLIIGNTANNTIDGGAGNDSLSGNAGNDTLRGGDGADTLDGGIGNDSLIGGIGNDSYFIDSTLDVVTETSITTTEIDNVTATISYTLGTNLENLTLGGSSNLNGTGNSLNNAIIGNSGVNTLVGASGNDTLDGAAGNDTISGDDGNDSLIGGSGNDSLSGGTGNDILDGGIGSDTLVGGTGNDSYFVDSTLDVVTETSTTATEIDSVTSSVTYTLGANLENLSLSGSGIINGTGNTLNNQIIGNGANNLLSGLAGNDILSGAAGNDTLDGGDGNDSLAGDDGNDSLIGGLGNDTLIGGLGDDILTGGAGVDILTGSGGTDRFLFDINAIFNASTMGIDGITDFSIGTDKIVLDKTTFTILKSAVSSGFSIAGEFASVANNAAAAVSTAYIVYSRGTGSLFYNQNGSVSGLGTGGEFANLSGLPNLTATDFIIQA